MKKLLPLVMMQLRDKIDFSLSNKKGLFREIAFTLIKFIIVAAITFVLLYLLQFFGVFYYSEAARIMILVLTFSLALSLITCTKDLMLNLYFSDDNKVLITLPANANVLFLSKLVVFYIYEIKRSLGFLLPITFGSVLYLTTVQGASIWVFIWMIIPMLFILMLPVLLGALLSIPVMFVYRFFKKYQIAFLIFIVLVGGATIFGIVTLINMIPENIDLMNQWPSIRNWIKEFLLNVEQNLFVMRNLVSSIIGERASNDSPAVITYMTFFKFIIIVLGDFVILFLAYCLSRPLFFNMMSKNFENNTKVGKQGRNVRHNKSLTFLNKELKINLRTISISVNYLLIYIALPIMVLLLNALYKAMDTKYIGDILIYTFNILIICLPLLASNALVATYYSREGRAGYMKKVKPIYALYPLLSKLFFNVIFSIPTVFVTVFIFGNSVDFDIKLSLCLSIAILFLHLGHMLWSATFDIMNPQNEQYATTGAQIDNPNENKSTIFAFILSFLFAIIAFVLFNETGESSIASYMVPAVKLLFISILFFIVIGNLFVKRIKAFYYE